MEQLNTNQNNNQDIQTKTGAQNSDKKSNHAKNSNSERNRHNSKFAQKPNRSKGPERTKEGQVMKSQNQSFGNGSNSTTQGRFSKRSGQNGEGAGKYKANRVETIEDIMADIERVEKDIQFEIKQIRAIKLGL